MKHISLLFALAALLVFAPIVVSPTHAQDQSNQGATAPNEVIPGTRFLIGLDTVLNTGALKAGEPFQARTLEPIRSADGTTLRPGAEIRGHVDKVEAAHKTGRARLWLTFDDIRTPDGWMPVVAMVSDVPGVHSVRVDFDREGEIEARSNKRQEEVEAAAAGAFVGATPGVVSHNTKEAAAGAAAGAATAFMAASGLGQELKLDKNTKIEVMLERSLYFGRS